MGTDPAGTGLHRTETDRYATSQYEKGATMNYAWQEYDWAAEDLARKGLRGLAGDPLPNLMSVEAVELINADPDAFARRVRECAYALAMQKLSRKEAL